jgi:DNA-binding XRE family transcriptional regulator
MCAVSAVGDKWSDRFRAAPVRPWEDALMQIPENGTSFRLGQLETQMKMLRAEVETMKTQLAAAKAQDIAEGNPDCEMEEKVELLKKIADLVGVDLGDVFDKSS